MARLGASERTGPVGVGVIGAGFISDTYLQNLSSFPDTNVLAVGDLYPEAAKSRAAEYNVPVAGDATAVLEHPDVEIVVNLTIPAAHAEVAIAALAAGKHVWNEKPLALERSAAQALLTAAERAGVRIGCAPDTFLGTGQQTARRLLEQGAVGEPLTALILLQFPGPEAWHPNPAFLYALGAGPLFDIGPYYWTTLASAFGPVAAVAATGSKSRAKRVIASGPRQGEEFEVQVPTHVAGFATFESGQSAEFVFSFDSGVRRTLLEVNGMDGTLVFPDPNTFGGDITLWRPGETTSETAASTVELSSRGTGVLDMARSLRMGRPHRASGALAYHVLDVMSSVADSIERKEFVAVESSFEAPDLLPEDWDPKAATL